MLGKLCSALDVDVNEVLGVSEIIKDNYSKVNNLNNDKFSQSTKAFIVDKLLELGFDLDIALDKADLDKQEYNNLTIYRKIKFEEILNSIGFSDNKIKELLER